MKYQLLENALRELILSGEGISENGQFMSERAISQMFSVSRSTVRRAIYSLCSQGYLSQIHGKGTFIKSIKDTQSLYSITRSAQNYTEMGLHSSIDVLCQREIPSSEYIASCLKIAKGDPVLYVEKLFRANRMTMNLTRSYLPATHFPEIKSANFAKTPIVELLRTTYHAYPRKTDHTIEAILAPADIAQHLGIAVNAPVILFESITSGIMDGRFLPLEYFKTYYRTDRLRFSFTQEHEAVE